MSDPSEHRESPTCCTGGRVCILLAGGLAAIGAFIASNLFLARSTTKPDAPSTRPVFPVPVVRPGKHENTAGAASYVGAAACVECHREEHESYLRTAHSQALNDVDLEQEPPDGRFEDHKSGRAYEIYRRNGQLRHRETAMLADGRETLLADFPMRYTIGSGRFSRSYLVEDDGFLVESPVTWYAARQAWGLSPGYEKLNTGFDRPAVLRCVNCHAGRIEPIDGSLHRMTFHAQVIDCERCHGPGSLHVERRLTGSESDPDLSIVHPRRLSRELTEAICAQCHLHSAATVDVRGRMLADFQPGLHLTDFSVHYVRESPTAAMEVVGHVEQMHLSKCYQRSDTFTCITCHDVHGNPEPEQRLEFYRAKCLSCHDEQACGLPPTERRERDALDNCVACHMPTSPTDIPHFAFTHHRVGIHDATPSPHRKSEEAGTLVPFGDISHLSEIDQNLCLGVGYAQAADNQQNLEIRRVYAERAKQILEQVRREGLVDADVDATLAKLYWQVDPDRSIELSRSAIEFETMSPLMRSSAQFTLGSSLYGTGRLLAAIGPLEELTRLKRYGPAWFVLSHCRQEAGDLDGALAAARRAVEITPESAEYHARLAELYSLRGNLESANRHRRQAQDMERFQARFNR